MELANKVIDNTDDFLNSHKKMNFTAWIVHLIVHNRMLKNKLMDYLNQLSP